MSSAARSSSRPRATSDCERFRSSASGSATTSRLSSASRPSSLPKVSSPRSARPLPRLPRRIGLVTGNDVAAKRDLVTAITARFPPARVLVAETYVQGPRAPVAIIEALRTICEAPEIDVVVAARGGGSFEDLLPFSDERLVRALTACGHHRLRSRSRAGHPALRSRSRRPGLDADCGGQARRPGPRGADCPTRPFARALSPGRARLSSASGAGSTAPAIIFGGRRRCSRRRRAAIEHTPEGSGPPRPGHAQARPRSSAREVDRPQVPTLQWARRSTSSSGAALSAPSGRHT